MYHRLKPKNQYKLLNKIGMIATLVRLFVTLFNYYASTYNKLVISPIVR